MNKANFDRLKHVRTPQEWIDKAAAIPDISVEKCPSFSMFRVAAAASIVLASIVLVSAVGLLVFLFFGDGSMPVVVRNGGSAATESFDGETTKSETSVFSETIAESSTDAQGNPVIVSQEQPASTVNGIQHTDGSRSPTENAPSPTTSSAPTPPRATDVPDQPSPTSSPDAMTDATAVPDSSATDPPATDPPPPPTEPPLTDCRITVTTGYPPPDGEIPSVETDEPIVFCRMYDAAGNLVGSSRLFAEEKRATVVSINPDDTFVVTYDPLEKGLPITRGRYTYVMVDYYLGTELCRGTVEY